MQKHKKRKTCKKSNKIKKLERQRRPNFKFFFLFLFFNFFLFFFVFCFSGFSGISDISVFFWYFWYLFVLSIRTSMQNLDFVAQELSELCSIWWPFCFLAAILFFKNFVKISSDCPYELPCKIWSLQLKKWLSYCTRYERGHLLIYHHISSSDYTVQTFLFKFRKFGQ